MIGSFFIQAAVSPSRQRVLRGTAAAHLILLAVGAGALLQAAAPGDRTGAELLLGYLALTAAIVEGALLVGWRLTQMPKSQALEFLLVTPLNSERVLLAEACVGLARLGFVSLAGLPVLLLLLSVGRLGPFDVVLLLVMPWTWGALTGLLFTAWAYESRAVRRWVERGLVVLLLVYLTVGVLAGEKLSYWLKELPDGGREYILWLLRWFHEHNPFGLVNVWFTRRWFQVWEGAVLVEALALAGGVLLLARCAARLRQHFHERHYQPAVDVSKLCRPPVGEQPLSWWAVRRVSEYSGRINLWLAGGFCVLYALYTVAGARWPDWLGRRVFEIAEGAGGIPVLTAGLIMLATVPAAFQYGLWDSNAQDRCRRLELLLLTDLEGTDYWHAAAAAAWQRGRGYFGLAVLLWYAGLVAGQLSAVQVLAAVAAAGLTWGCYFALGFRDFARGRNAHSLGLLLTLGLPLLVCLAGHLGWQELSALVPPGSIHAAGSGPATWPWLAGTLAVGWLTLDVTRTALSQCDSSLRDWYDQHSGSKVLD